VGAVPHRFGRRSGSSAVKSEGMVLKGAAGQ
jgi:hypothetical protein